MAAVALAYANEICKNRVRDKYNLSDQLEIGLAFFNGTKLADMHPRPGLVKIEDVRAIYMAWQEEGDFVDFVDYLKDECRKEGLL